MPRPLMQRGVAQLEEMFSKGKADAKLLKQLEHELKHRQVPRAVALLAEVQAAMCGGAAALLTTAPISQQPDLWGRPATPPVVSPPASVRNVALAVRTPDPPPVAKSPASTLAMPLEDAYKILKATPGATWESIEQMRRTLVHQSSPSRWKTLSAEKRAQSLEEAKRVNAAYAALSHARCGERLSL